MKPSKELTAYACTGCTALYRDEIDAAACCVCNKCATKMQRATGGQCDYCFYTVDLKRARMDVKSTKKSLKHREAYLARLLKQKRPPKGTVRKGW